MQFTRIENSIINLAELRMIEILAEKRNDKKYGILVYFYWRNNINPCIKNKIFEELEDVEKFKLDFLSSLGIDENNASFVPSTKADLMQRIASL